MFTQNKTLKEEGGSQDDFSLQLGPTSLGIRQVALGKTSP
jgi:hypothetical protein